MEKRKVIIITIISTIVSLILILLSYFGIFRYLMLHINSSEPYIHRYSSLPSADKGKVVLAISTTPERINKIKPMINSILDQTVKITQIILIIPHDDSYKLPSFLQKIVTLYPLGKEYGDNCCNTMVPMMLHEKECDTTIIALLDNVVYGKDFIETLLELSDKNPGLVLRDLKKTAILFKPEYYDCSVVDTTDWFKKSKDIDYSENYKCIGTRFAC